VDAASFGGTFGANLLRDRLLATGTPAILLRNGDSIKDKLSSIPPPQRVPVLPSIYAVPTV
jgi:hypothetical protein